MLLSSDGLKAKQKDGELWQDGWTEAWKKHLHANVAERRDVD